MRKLLLPAIAALTIMGAGQAFADTRALGVIMHVDPLNKVIVLEDGSYYSATGNFGIKAFNAGEKVRLILDGNSNVIKWVEYGETGEWG